MFIEKLRYPTAALRTLAQKALALLPLFSRFGPQPHAVHYPDPNTSPAACSLRQVCSQTWNSLAGYSMRPLRFTNRGTLPSLLHLASVVLGILAITDAWIGVRGPAIARL